MRRPTLKRRVLLWLVAYVVLLTITIVASGTAFHEHAEHLAFKALLESEFDNLLDRTRREPDYVWQDSDTLSLYAIGNGQAAPAALRGLGPGMHDDVDVANRESVVLVRDTAQRGRLALVLDITDFEELEAFMTRWIALAIVAIVLITMVMAWLGMGRVVRPLSALAERIGALRPEASGERVDAGPRASSEMVVIADAVNDYVQRNERFVERERAFINSASHELRTPIAVIGGAADLALGQEGVPATARAQMQRVQRTARGVEQLVSLLLVLARDPARLSALEDRVALDELLPEIVEDHLHLSREKDLRLQVADLPRVTVIASLAIVQAAIGNLVRNAIENSDRGDIALSLRDDGVVVIDDPGHGMTPEEISTIHARMARGDGGQGDGIGLDLIARLCEHLGWRLQIEPRTPRGTRVTLDLGAALVGTRHL